MFVQHMLNLCSGRQVFILPENIKSSHTWFSKMHIGKWNLKKYNERLYFYAVFIGVWQSSKKMRMT